MEESEGISEYMVSRAVTEDVHIHAIQQGACVASVRHVPLLDESGVSILEALARMTAQVARRTPFVKGDSQRLFLASPNIAALSQVRGRVLRSARALTTMAASSYKYVVLGGGNSSG